MAKIEYIKRTCRPSGTTGEKSNALFEALKGNRIMIKTNPTPEEVYERARNSVLCSLAHYKRAIDEKDHVHDMNDVIEWTLNRADDAFEELTGREFVPAMRRPKD